MAITIARTDTDLLGSVATPSTIAATATGTASLDLTATAGTIEAVVAVKVQVGASVPTTNITIRYSYSLDGTNYFQQGGDISLAPVASTNFDFTYSDIPFAAKKAQISIINGATNSITAYGQGCVLSVS